MLTVAYLHRSTIVLKSVPLLRIIVRSGVGTCLMQHCRLYNKCSLVRASVCCVSSLTVHKNSSEPYTITSTQCFLTFHLSYNRRACHYWSFEGWMGSGLHDTCLFASRKLKLHRHFASMSAMVSFDRHMAV